MKLRINKFSILIFISVMLDLNCFYLVEKYSFIAGIGFYDIVFIYKMLIIIATFLQYPRELLTKHKLGSIIMCGIIISCCSAIGGNITYGQSIIQGLVAQREWISSLLFFYPIYIWLKKGKITSKQVISAIIAASIIYLLLIYTVFFTGISSIVLKTSISERYGDTRLRLDSSFMLLLLGFLIDRFYIKKKSFLKKYRDIILIIAIILFIALITKERMRTIAALVACMICVLIRKNSLNKKIIGIMIVIIGAIFFMQSSIGKDVLDIIFGSGLGTGDDTLTIRNYERLYYMELLFKKTITLFLGCGYPVASNSIASAMTTPTIGYWTYYASDIGILGEFFYYGILGILWCIISYIITFYNSFKIYKTTNETAFIQILLIDIIACYTLVPTIFGYRVSFSIYLALLANKINEMKGLKSNDISKSR